MKGILEDFALISRRDGYWELLGTYGTMGAAERAAKKVIVPLKWWGPTANALRLLADPELRLEELDAENKGDER